MEMQWCPKHQKEYEDWLNDLYVPSPCDCGANDWIDGTLQMTDPPTKPEMNVFRCKECNGVQLEVARDGKKRIRTRD
jgi:hypothetical protein